jgi:flagellin-specific chaperone FliS
MLPPDYVLRASAPSGGTAARARLLLLALEGGQAFLLRARDALARRDLAAFVADVQRTRLVFREIARSHREAPDAHVAAGLDRLEDLMVGDLALASAERCTARFEELVTGYGAVLDAYRAAVRDAPA